MAETAWSVDRLPAAAARADAPRHHALVRVTHWLTAVCFLALLVSGLEIVVSHPRFYWGETGNVLTPALFSLPIPASRATVPTGYGFVLPDQNGWSRALHFQSAWVRDNEFEPADQQCEEAHRRQPVRHPYERGVTRRVSARGDGRQSVDA